jgi:hypothetical protein
MLPFVKFLTQVATNRLGQVACKKKITSKNCALPGYYVSSCYSLPRFRDRQVVPKRRYGINRYLLRNRPEESDTHLLRGGTLKSNYQVVCTHMWLAANGVPQDFVQKERKNQTH